MTPEQYAARQKARAKPAGVEACAAFSRLYSAEADVLKAVLATLEMHPKVAWVARMNSGAFEVEGRFGKETADQAAFGARVAEEGGLYFVARSVDDVMGALA